MSELSISIITFAFVFGGALLGMYLRNALPGHHLRNDVKDVVRLSTGLIGTMAARVLGLLIASAKSSYDARTTQIKQITANIILLDQLLEQYGSDAQNLRISLRRAVPPWSIGFGMKAIVRRMRHLRRPPKHKTLSIKFKNSSRTMIQNVLFKPVCSGCCRFGQVRLALFTQAHDSIPVPFLAILIFWLAIIFTSFGLFVRTSPVVIVTFFIGALSVACAIFLILEMDQPFAGAIADFQ